MCAGGERARMVRTGGEAAGRLKAAELYEREWVPAMLQQWAVRLADVAPVTVGHRVLDVGCGTGVVARECAGRIGGTGRVAGLDISHEMLSVARNIAPAIEWHRGDAQSLPFADASFDRVVSQFALMFFPDRSQAVAEMWRVLRPGGRLAIIVSGPLQDTPAYVELIKLVRRHVGEVGASSIESRFVLGDLDRLEKIFVSAGVGEFTIETCWGSERFLSPGHFAEAEIRANSELIDLFDESSLTALLQEAEQKLNFLITDEDHLEIRSPGHIVTATKA